jgi:D-aminopeptidase
VVEAIDMARKRLRELGISTGLLRPGPLNAITDVAGVRVGVATLIADAPHVVRTGVTAIWPRGEEIWQEYCFAGTHSFNGNGEMTGIPWIAEQGLLGAPICITNTWSVGIVRDAISAAALKAGATQNFHLPVAAETYDGWLSESERFPVTMELAIEAIESAKAGPVPEGNVGGGTGMITHEFKGGTGTASRVVDGWTVGALVQSNYGARELFRVDGVPVGRMIGPEVVPSHRTVPREAGSIIVVLATDAPLLPIQCQRLARRATTGLAWVGGIGGNGSGDIFIAFSTGNRVRQGDAVSEVRMIAPEAMTNLFQAAAEATEEAILNAMCAAETMTGREGRVIHALPHDLLVQAVRGRGSASGG